MSAVAAAGPAPRAAPYTITGLKKWSCLDKDLPDVNEITVIHVYDFDNTLFCSPLPNPELWAPANSGILKNEKVFIDGGWFHDPTLLASVGNGADAEAAKGWEGWWNEGIVCSLMPSPDARALLMTQVNMVKMSMEQPNVLTVLLTGRARDGFAELIVRMVKSKSLEFDLICLKTSPSPDGQRAPTTEKFKTGFLEYAMQVYHEAEEIRVYEDRQHHVRRFREFFTAFNAKYTGAALQGSGLSRKRAINSDVIPVPEAVRYFDGEQELTLVKGMIRTHNAKLATLKGPHQYNFWETAKQVFFIGYKIDPVDRKKLLEIAKLGPQSDKHDGARRYGNWIIMAAKTSIPEEVAKRAGEIGTKLRWKAVSLGDSNKTVFSMRVRPVPQDADFHVEGKYAHVGLLATVHTDQLKEFERVDEWVPLHPSDQYEFETTIQEKAGIRLINKATLANEHNPPGKSTFNNHGKRGRNLEGPSDPGRRSNATQKTHYNEQGRSAFSGPNHGGPSGRKGGRGGHKNDGGRGGKTGGGRGGANNGKKGRANFQNYKSLDDMGTNGNPKSKSTSGHDAMSGLKY